MFKGVVTSSPALQAVPPVTSLEADICDQPSKVATISDAQLQRLEASNLASLEAALMQDAVLSALMSAMFDFAPTDPPLFREGVDASEVYTLMQALFSTWKQQTNSAANALVCTRLARRDRLLASSKLSSDTKVSLRLADFTSGYRQITSSHPLRKPQG